MQKISELAGEMNDRRDQWLDPAPCTPEIRLATNGKKIMGAGKQRTEAAGSLLRQTPRGILDTRSADLWS